MTPTKTLFALLLTVALAAPARAEEAPTGVPALAYSGYLDYTASLLDRALSLLGVSYRHGGTDPARGLDCSGLVRFVFADALKLTLPRSARDISRLGENISLADLKPGDLVFFNTLRRTFSHVGIYIGGSRFVHATSSGGTVRIDDLRHTYWARRFNGARRIDPTA